MPVLLPYAPEEQAKLALRECEQAVEAPGCWKYNVKTENPNEEKSPRN